MPPAVVLVMLAALSLPVFPLVVIRPTSSRYVTFTVTFAPLYPPFVAVATCFPVASPLPKWILTTPFAFVRPALAEARDLGAGDRLTRVGHGEGDGGARAVTERRRLRGEPQTGQQLRVPDLDGVPRRARDDVRQHVDTARGPLGRQAFEQGPLRRGLDRHDGAEAAAVGAGPDGVDPRLHRVPPQDPQAAGVAGDEGHQPRVPAGRSGHRRRLRRAHLPEADVCARLRLRSASSTPCRRHRPCGRPAPPAASGC